MWKGWGSPLAFSKKSLGPASYARCMGCLGNMG